MRLAVLPMLSDRVKIDLRGTNPKKAMISYCIHSQPKPDTRIENNRGRRQTDKGRFCLLSQPLCSV